MAAHPDKVRVRLWCRPGYGGVTDHYRLLPSFFIVGPPRTGTSWLHEVLQTHTLLPRAKETRFFDTHFDRGLHWYRGHFPTAHNGQRAGEVAPTYFASTEARERIVEQVPDARVVCIFRNPIDRVYSHYRIRSAYAMIPWSFEEALHRDAELIESTKYATHLKAWQQALGPDRVKSMMYEDLKENPQLFIDELTDFIGIARISLTPSQIRYVNASRTLTHPRSYYRTHGGTIVADWLKARKLAEVVALIKRSPLRKLFLGGGPCFAQPAPETLHDLYEQFRPEVDELEALLGRDLSRWKSPEAHLLPAA